MLCKGGRGYPSQGTLRTKWGVHEIMGYAAPMNRRQLLADLRRRSRNNLCAQSLED